MERKLKDASGKEGSEM